MAQCFTPELRSSGNLPVVSAFLASLPPATATATGTVTLNPSGALLSDILIRLDVAGAETYSISGKTFGGDTVAAAAFPLTQVTTGNPIAATALASGYYTVPVDRGGSIFQSIIFTKSAAIQIGSASVACAYDVQGNL